MTEFLASSWFKYLVLPLLSVAFGVFIKFATKNDQYAKFSKEDFAVGFDLMRSAILAYAVLLSDGASVILKNKAVAVDMSKNGISGSYDEVASGGWTMMIMMCGVWGTSTFVRKVGWKSDVELRPLGLTIPLVIGLLYLVFVMMKVR